MDELDTSGFAWMATLCQEGHGLCYEITHMGSRFHFQPGDLEWHHAQLMETLRKTEKELDEGEDND